MADTGEIALRHNILLTAEIHPAARQMLEEIGDVRVATSADEASLCADVAEADAILVRHPITPQVIDAGKSLRVIARHGVGLDYIPIDKATERGIPVVFTPDANTESVAEHALGMMIALAHNFPRGDAAVRSGNWEQRHSLVGMDLKNRTLGLIGCGRIGGRLAELCRAAFDMEILVYDPGITASELRAKKLVPASMETVLKNADFISVHAPLTLATTGLISSDVLGRMKPTAYLINAARGGIVDTVALAEALATGRLAGAALDVFPDEPPSVDSPLLSCKRALLTPHSAAHTEEALRNMGCDAATDILRIFRGERPLNCANPQIWKTKEG